ncbi:hypothetical protein OG323_34325 [Streptomyces cyaneofuscatus]|uniref:hypothetical protein n=1 Tax=Streptomyces cyaneofuscatus TaxID=66883 RepID=UPI00386F3BEB|nr:hypothetical protein OG323_34325 [Streptomyces cyaneofuscatus]
MIDVVVTLVAATALAGIGVLIPAFEENYDMPAGRHLAEAAPFFGGGRPSSSPRSWSRL